MLYTVVSKQLIELSLVKIEILSKTLLHYVTPNNNTHYLG